MIRDGRGLRLTIEGKCLGSDLSDALFRITAAVECIRQPLRGDKLRVPVPPIFASAWLVFRLDLFATRRPVKDVICIDMVEWNGVAGNADIVIAWGRFEDDSTVVVDLLGQEAEALHGLFEGEQVHQEQFPVPEHRIERRNAGVGPEIQRQKCLRRHAHRLAGGKWPRHCPSAEGGRACCATDFAHGCGVEPRPTRSRQGPSSIHQDAFVSYGRHARRRGHYPPWLRRRGVGTPNSILIVRRVSL